MNKQLTIFGREPALIVGALEAVLAALLAFGLGISPDSYGPWVALVVAAGGLLTAIGTKDTLLGAVIGLLKAGVVLVAVYGLTLTDQQTGALIGVTSVIFAFLNRDRTTPLTAISAADGAYNITTVINTPPELGDALTQVAEHAEHTIDDLASPLGDSNPGGGDDPVLYRGGDN